MADMIDPLADGLEAMLQKHEDLPEKQRQKPSPKPWDRYRFRRLPLYRRSMGRPLNSDMLGTMNENRFGDICASASLHANKVCTDRTGWDFYVEFPFPPGPNVSRLDSRPQPPEFKVQVKTVWTNAKNIKFRLSSAERLAKWAGAAFIVVLVVNDSTLEFTSMHVLHVRGETLSTILKALRTCERDNSTQVNHRFVRLDHLRDGDALPVTGAALKHHVSAAVGTDLSRYAREKQAERDNLGVKGARWSIAMTLNASYASEAADIMLGIKPGRFSRLAVEETRWGITRPAKGTEGPGMAWCAVAPMEFHDEGDGLVRLDLGELSLRRVELLEDGDEAFKDFTELVQDETDIRLVLKVGT